MMGVYSITNPDNEIYVGSSINIQKRWASYKSSLAKSQKKLNISFLKHGIKKHRFKVLIECKLEDLYEWEFHFANYFDSLGVKGLNSSIPKFGSVKIISDPRFGLNAITKSYQLSPDKIEKLNILFITLKKSGAKTSKNALIGEALDLLFKKYKI